MIIGDPYKFAILSGVINEWNIDDTFCNGVLLFCVNGDIYPKEVVTATLGSEIEYLRQKLRNLTTDKASDVMNAQEQVYQTPLFRQFIERIQNGLKAALSATPEQYPALREVYRQYTILPEEYAAKLLGCL